MAEKPSPNIFRESENSQKLYKILKVVGKPYKNMYVPGFNLQGKYLEAYGFEKGTITEVIVSENKILISKIIEEKK
ncbi:MAG: hypothetical protein R2764_08390 [Bacteroidales bacterium]